MISESAENAGPDTEPDAIDDEALQYDYSQYEIKEETDKTDIENENAKGRPSTGQEQMKQKLASIGSTQESYDVFMLFMAGVLLFSCIAEVGKKANEENKSKFWLAIFFSIFIIGFILLLSRSRKKEGFTQQKSLIAISALALIWISLTAWLTSDDVFNVTGNGYFALWGGTLITLRFLFTETSLATGVFRKIELVGWEITLLLGSCLVLGLASHGSDHRLSSYGIFLSIFSGLGGVALYFFVNRITGHARLAIVGGLFLLWILGAGILTSAGPFSVTGNGYFSVWCGTIVTGLMLNKLVNFGESQVLKSSAANPGAV